MNFWKVFCLLCVCQGITFEESPCFNGSGNLQLKLDEGIREFLFVGEWANMTCIYTGNITNFSPHNFYFKVRKNEETYIIPNIMTTNSTHVEIKMSDLISYAPQSFYDYNCIYNHSEENQTCFKRKMIHFDYPPAPISNFYCILFNWQNMECFCDFGVVYRSIYTHINVTAGIKGFDPSPVPSANLEQINGTFLKITIPPDIFSTAIYRVTINVTSKARNNYSCSSFTFDPVVYAKPDKIQDFKLSKNSTYFELKWGHNNQAMRKKFRIRYQSEYDKIDNKSWMPPKEIIQTKARPLKDTSGFSLMLNDLSPYTKYYIKMDVRPLFDNGSETGYWSDLFEDTAQTDEDVPRAVPKFWPGYFSQKGDVIKIYWQPIDERNKCGIITFYKVEIEEVIEFGDNENNENKTRSEEFPASDNVLSHDIHLESHKKYKIHLSQRTSIGYPKLAASHIYIFPKEHRPKLSATYLVEALNSTCVEITWGPAALDVSKEILEISTYHIAWCKSRHKECVEPIQTILTPYTKPEVNNLTIFLSKGHYSDYKFGLSVEAVTKQGRFISSGIAWNTECIYLRGGMPKDPPDLKIPSDVDQEEGLEIKWTPYGCENNTGKVDSYVVNYCEAGNKEGECQDIEVNKTLPSNLTAYKLQNLVKGRKYWVKVAAKMVNDRIGPWSESKKALMIDYPIQTVEKVNIVIAVAVGGSIAFIFLAIIAFFFIRRCLRKANQEARDISPPNIQIFTVRSHLETIENANDIGESQQPLLRHSGNDSGLGGSFFNTNGISNDHAIFDKKYSYQNGRTGYHDKSLQQNGSAIHSSAILESPAFNSNDETLYEETSFSTPENSDNIEKNSGYYTDFVEHNSSDDDSSINNSSSFSNHRNSDKFADKKCPKLIVGNHCDIRNYEESAPDSNCVDSYCQQGEHKEEESSSTIDSYCEQGVDSGLALKSA